MTTLQLLELAEIQPLEALGGAKSIRNREEFSRKVADHARMRLVWCWILLMTFVAVCLGGLAFAFILPEMIKKGLMSFLGGSSLVAWLGLTVRAINSYSEDRMTLLVLEHGTNAQVAEYIEALLDAKRKKAARTGGQKRRGQS
jgi:hypothetical protein